MAGVGDLLAGGIVGTLCSELFQLLVNLINKTKKFSHLLAAIKLTVGDLNSLIPEIQDLNEKLEISNKGTDRLKKTLSDGIKLVDECSRDPKWYKKSKYTDKLTALDEALQRELNMLKAHAARDAKENLLLARKDHDYLVELASDGRKGLEMARKQSDQLVELARDGRKGLEMTRKQSDQLVELARDGRKGLEMTRKQSDQLVELARDGRKGLEMTRKQSDQLVELARDGRNGLEMASKQSDQLVELARDGRKGLEMASKQSDQLVELASDGRQTLDAVKEMKIIQFLGFCIIIIFASVSFYALNFIEPRPSTTITTLPKTSSGKATTPTLVKYDADSDEDTTPTPVKHDTDSDKTTTPTRPFKKKDPEGSCLDRILSRVRKRIATAVQDRIILPVLKVCKWGVQWAMLLLARTFVLLLVLAHSVLCLALFVWMDNVFNEEIDRQVKRGVSRRDLRSFIWFAIGVILVLTVYMELIFYQLKKVIEDLD